MFSFDGGGVLEKISNKETIERLKDCNLDYETIRNLSIYTHQSVPSFAKFFYDTASVRDEKRFITPVADKSLPSVIEEFLSTQNSPAKNEKAFIADAIAVYSIFTKIAFLFRFITLFLRRRRRRRRCLLDFRELQGLSRTSHRVYRKTFRALMKRRRPKLSNQD